MATPGDVLAAPSVVHVLLMYMKGDYGVVPRVQATACAAILFWGVLKLAVSARSFLSFVWRQLLRPAEDLKPQYGEWAVVTGATDGIGREYCNELAAKGLNIYLISRTESKLRAAAKEIADKYKVETKVYAADLVAAGATSHDDACWYGLKKNLADMDIGILVNNAGMSYEYPEYLHAVDTASLASIISINCASLTKMTHTVLAGMVKRKRGCIVNISSGVASSVPCCPLLAVYAASKAYVNSFSESLAMEYAPYGIDVQAQSPEYVSTKMSKIRKSSLAVPTPSTWVKAAIKHVGHEARAVPYPAHALLSAAMKSLPDKISAWLWFTHVTGIRAKALKKKEGAKKQ